MSAIYILWLRSVKRYIRSKPRIIAVLGTAIASVLSDYRGFQLVMNVLVLPIFFLSGAVPVNQPAQGVGHYREH